MSQVPDRQPFFTGKRRAFFLAFSHRIVPGVARLDAAGEADFFRIVEDVLAERPRGVRRQIALFLFVLRWLPFLFSLRPLDALAPGRQDRILRGFQDAPLTLVRKGFWGVRTLVFMGYYGRPAVYPSIGYNPSRRGNERLQGERSGTDHGR